MIRLVISDGVAADKLPLLERMGRGCQPQDRFGMELLDALPGDAQPLGDNRPRLRWLPGEAIACHDDVGQPARQLTDQVVEGVAHQQALYFVQRFCWIERGVGWGQPSAA